MSDIYFVNTIVFVKDLALSKKFYAEVVGLKVMNSYDTIVWFENDLTLHAADDLHKTIFKEKPQIKDEKQGRRNMDIYLECTNLEERYQLIKNNGVEFIHPIEKQPWGQHVFRFFDPDGHIVEIGEPHRVDFRPEGNSIRY